jgi:hypothetical protein
MCIILIWIKIFATLEIIDLKQLYCQKGGGFRRNLYKDRGP